MNDIKIIFHEMLLHLDLGVVVVLQLKFSCLLKQSQSWRRLRDL